MSAHAQDKAPLHTDTEMSFIIGGKVGYYPRYFRNTLIIRSGIFANASLLKLHHKRLYTGMGMGLMAINEETFVPIFINFKAKLSENENGFYFGIKTGYSPGFNRKLSQVAYNNYSGGWFLSTTLGYQTKIKDDLSFHFGLQWVHQRAVLRVEPQTAESPSKEPLRFHFMGIMCGLNF